MSNEKMDAEETPHPSFLILVNEQLWFVYRNSCTVTAAIRIMIARRLIDVAIGSDVAHGKGDVRRPCVYVGTGHRAYTARVRNAGA